MNEYWSWWQGALALGALTIFFVFMLGRMLGVSGSWASIMSWREQRLRQKISMAMHANAAAMQDALMAATVAEFGSEKIQLLLGGHGMALPPRTAVQAPATGLRWTAHLTFLLFIAIGGFLAALTSGHLEIRLDLGATHTRLFGTGWQEWLTLLAGGTLVGFGTQMGSGCTSGHGLSGVSRLAPASLAATALFFASAVATSFLVEGLLP